jgi:DNA-binding MarR family transcriptional regulator
MTNLFEEIAGLDRIIHEPARLSILTALASCKSADYLFLQRLTGLTGGNLSSHISKLVESGLVQIEKSFIKNKPNTQIEITEKGQAAIELHWEQLEKLHKASKTWKPLEKGKK